MKIFVDLHHADLYYSLHVLLEKRLGFELYRPIGMDWFHENHWKIADVYNRDIATARQFLDINSNIPIVTSDDDVEKYNTKNYFKDDVYHMYDSDVHFYYQKAITLETFKNMKFDIIMSTYEPHDFTFEKLRNEYQPSAKLVAQLGNTFQQTHYKNVIHSVPYNASSDQNSVLIHQEIDTNLYKSVYPSVDTKNIYSVVSLAPYLDIFNQYKNILTECNFKYYGINCPDGILNGCRGVSEKMREANLGWCLKPLGGLGHSNMGWCYSGRPIITNMSQHRFFGGVALQLFEPNVTCIDIESDDVELNINKIRDWLLPENTIKYGEQLRNRFLELVNYDVEEQRFRQFLSKLL